MSFALYPLMQYSSVTEIPGKISTHASAGLPSDVSAGKERGDNFLRRIKKSLSVEKPPSGTL